jgi:hypothetical protein
VVVAGRRRRAHKPLHLFKSLFSLFNLEWPSNIKSYEKAHEMFLDTLGPIGVRSIALFAPFGIPGRYSWAPLSFFSTFGNLLSDVDTMDLGVTTDLINPLNRNPVWRWLCLKVRLLSSVFGVTDWTELLPVDSNITSFRPIPTTLTLEGEFKVFANAYLSPSFRMEGATSGSLFLLRPADADINSMEEHYVIGSRMGIIGQEGKSLWKMMKVAVVEIRPPLRGNSVIQGCEVPVWVTWEGII